MKLLLDTHTFIWWASEPEQLSSKAISLLEDEQNEPVISVVNIWEMQIKDVVGKMNFNFSLDDIIKTYRENAIDSSPFIPIMYCDWVVYPIIIVTHLTAF